MKFAILTRFFSEGYHVVIGNIHEAVLKKFMEKKLAQAMDETQPCYAWLKDISGEYIRVTGVPSGRKDRLGRPIRYTLSFLGEENEISVWKTFFAKRFMEKNTLDDIGFFLDSFTKDNESFVPGEKGEENILEGLEKILTNTDPRIPPIPDNASYLLSSPLFDTGSGKEDEVLSPEGLGEKLPEGTPPGCIIVDGKLKPVAEKKKKRILGSSPLPEKECAKNSGGWRFRGLIAFLIGFCLGCLTGKILWIQKTPAEIQDQSSQKRNQDSRKQQDPTSTKKPAQLHPPKDADPGGPPPDVSQNAPTQSTPVSQGTMKPEHQKPELPLPTTAEEKGEMVVQSVPGTESYEKKQKTKPKKPVGRNSNITPRERKRSISPKLGGKTVP